MNKEEQYRKTTGCVQTNRSAAMLRSVQGASVRVPSPLARLFSPLEQQRAELGARLVRYPHSPTWQALENQCLSMRCSIMSKRTAASDTTRPWGSRPAASPFSPPVATRAAGHDAVARSHCEGPASVWLPERCIATSSRGRRLDTSVLTHRASRHSHILPPGPPHGAA
jgi:hypothetical protein